MAWKGSGWVAIFKMKAPLVSDHLGATTFQKYVVFKNFSYIEPIDIHLVSPQQPFKAGSRLTSSRFDHHQTVNFFLTPTKCLVYSCFHHKVFYQHCHLSSSETPYELETDILISQIKRQKSYSLLSLAEAELGFETSPVHTTAPLSDKYYKYHNHSCPRLLNPSCYWVREATSLNAKKGTLRG